MWLLTIGPHIQQLPGFAHFLLSVAVTWHVLVWSLIGRPQCLSHAWSHNTTASSLSFYFNFPSILSISPSFPVSMLALFFFFISQNHYPPLPPFFLPLCGWIPGASLALFILSFLHLKLLLLLLLAVLWVSVSLSFCLHQSHYHLATSRKITSTDPHACKCFTLKPYL